MSNHSVTFNGKTLTIPGVYSSIESSMTYSKQESSAKVIGLIGESTGGEPDTVHFFSDPGEAKRMLKSGDLLKACQKAWNPVSKTKDGLELGGADIIACIRSNRATRAQKIIYATESSEAKIDEVVQKVSEETTGTVAVSGTFTGDEAVTYVFEITNSGTIESEKESETEVTFNYHTAVEDTPLSSSDISAKTNFAVPDSGITVSFTAGTYTTGDQFIVGCTPAVTESTPLYAFVSKDYGKDNNKIQVKIDDGTTKGSKRVTVFDVKSDKYEVFDNLGFAFSISYTGEQNYAELCIITDGNGNAVKLQTKIGEDKSNSIVDLDIDLDKSAFKTIRALVRHIQAYENYVVSYDPYCNTFCSVSDLDKVSGANIKGESYVVTQMLSDIKTKLDNDSSFVTIKIYNKEVSTVNNLTYTSLSGGSEGKSPASWSDYFDLMSKYDIRYIVPLTSDDYILAECQEHVNEMSDTFGLERRAIVGTDAGKTVSEACTIAQNLADGRVQLVYPGMYDLDENGDTVLYPGYILAAAFAGRVATLPDGEAATHDVFRMSGIEKELEPEEISKLIDSGVVTFEFKISTDSIQDSYVQCVQDLTTSREDDILQVERAVGITADDINRTIRKEINGLTIGRKILTGGLTTIKNTVKSVLLKKKEQEEVIVDFKDISVYSSGDLIYIEYSAAPTQPNNFTLVTGHFYKKDLMAADSDTVEE